MTRPSNGSRYPINKRNQRRLHGLIDNLFNDYSKLLIVRLDFYIQKDYELINTYDYLNEAFERLRNNQRFNSLFEHYITYVARLEYGTDRKWHYHVLFFFDGQRVRDDYGLAKAIGEYWEDVITRRLGSYHSPNMNKARYRKVGVGMIGYRDEDKIECLKKDVANYLVKVDINSSGTSGRRTYRQGQYKPKQGRLGRPREADYPDTYTW